MKFLHDIMTDILNLLDASEEVVFTAQVIAWGRKNRCTLRSYSHRRVKSYHGWTWDVQSPLVGIKSTFTMDDYHKWHLQPREKGGLNFNTYDAVQESVINVFGTNLIKEKQGKLRVVVREANYRMNAGALSVEDFLLDSGGAVLQTGARNVL